MIEVLVLFKPSATKCWQLGILCVHTKCGESNGELAEHTVSERKMSSLTKKLLRAVP